MNAQRIIKWIATAAFLVSSSFASADIVIDLVGTKHKGFGQMGPGDRGLSIGVEKSTNYGSSWNIQSSYNAEFNWNPIQLKINENTGNASIVTTSLDRHNSSQVWSLDIQLGYAGVKSGAAPGTINMAAINNLFQGKDNNGNALSSDWGYGFTVDSMNLSLNGSSFNIAMDGYKMNHDFEFELYYDKSLGAVTAMSWYKQITPYDNSGKYRSRYWGDTKAIAMYTPSEPSPGIPIPTTAALLGLGLLALGRKKLQIVK